jgi:hypothetical protein
MKSIALAFAIVGVLGLGALCAQASPPAADLTTPVVQGTPAAAQAVITPVHWGGHHSGWHGHGYGYGVYRPGPYRYYGYYPAPRRYWYPNYGYSYTYPYPYPYPYAGPYAWYGYGY